VIALAEGSSDHSTLVPWKLGNSQLSAAYGKQAQSKGSVQFISDIP